MRETPAPFPILSATTPLSLPAILAVYRTYLDTCLAPVGGIGFLDTFKDQNIAGTLADVLVRWGQSGGAPLRTAIDQTIAAYLKAGGDPSQVPQPLGNNDTFIGGKTLRALKQLDNIGGQTADGLRTRIASERDNAAGQSNDKKRARSFQ